MRIIAGSHRGRAILTPPGLGTRPTSDRLRQTIFNILSNAPWSPIFWPETIVIDAFAGSGALGFEALSRGAQSALFFDTNRAAQKCLAENARNLGLLYQCKIINNSVLIPPPLNYTANLVFLDPPYHQNLVLPALAALTTANILTSACLAVIETASDEALSAPTGWVIHDQRVQGKSKITFWGNS